MITKARGLWCSLPGGCCISWQLPLVRKGRSLGAKLLMGPSCLWTWWGDACPGAALYSRLLTRTECIRNARSQLQLTKHKQGHARC